VPNQSDETRMAILQNDIGYIKKQLDSIDNKVSNHYVSKEEFEPIKKIVYGLVGLILVGVVGAMVSLVVR
jgi:tetrahydromethanopterin S-methyltransferase subunit G